MTTTIPRRLAVVGYASLALTVSVIMAGCAAGPEQAGGTSRPAEAAREAAPETSAPPAAGRGAEEPTAARRGDRADEGENTALIEAAERGEAGAVRRLLGEGASVRARDANGRTALVAAAFGNHLGAAEALIEAGADVNAKDETEQSAYLISRSEVGDAPRLLGLTLRNGAHVGSLDSYDGTEAR